MQHRSLVLFLVGPAVFILVSVALFPILAVIGLSLQRRLPIFDIAHFVGLENYLFLIGDLRFWNALGNTVYFTIVSVTFEIGLGLAIAIQMDSTYLDSLNGLNENVNCSSESAAARHLEAPMAPERRSCDNQIGL